MNQTKQPKTGSKFTPGPWTVHANGTTIRAYLPHSKNRSYASVAPHVHPENARLIAAAPEMYELLSTLAEDNFLCDNGNSVCDEARRIKAAIESLGR